jgi:hypothetical protein
MLCIIFDFQQLLLLTNFDQTHGYGDCIIFGDTFDRAITFGDTFCATPASKNQFRNIPTRNLATYASGLGSSPPPSPPPSAT